eukprot:4951402-Prymnesium_polylepis.1
MSCKLLWPRHESQPCTRALAGLPGPGAYSQHWRAPSSSLLAGRGEAPRAPARGQLARAQNDGQ